MITLTVIEPEGQRSSLEIDRELTIGRDPSCGLVISHPSVSRIHARLTPKDSGLQIEDLESKAGVLVNGRRIQSSTELLEGDLVAIGPVSIIAHLNLRLEDAIAGRNRDSGSVRHLTRRVAIASEQFSSTKRYLRDSKALGASLEKISEQLEALLNLATTLARFQDRSALFPEVARQLLDLFKEADRVIILEPDDPNQPDQQKVKFVLEGPHARLGQGAQHSNEVIAEAVQRREAVLRESEAEADNNSAAHGDSIPMDGPRSIACAPLWHRERILGALYLDSRTALFGEGALRFLTAMANIVATALDNVLLFEAVRRESAQRASLARYFSKDLVERIVVNEIPYAREGREHRATICMVDLCGFTRLTTEVPPALLISSLNAYFAAMQRIIFKNKGTVERFGGDSILAYWGVIEEDKFAAWRGCFAALSMQNEMLPLNYELRKAGTPTLSISVGVNTGDVIAGDVGSEERFEFTVLGDAVNMTRRLQDLAEPGQVLIGSETRLTLGRSALAKDLLPRVVKGRDQPLKFAWLYGVRDASDKGVHFILSLGVFLRCAGSEAHGRATGLRYMRRNDNRYQAWLTLSVFEEPEPGPAELRLAFGDTPVIVHGEVLGDLVESQATAYWSSVKALQDGPCQVRIQIDQAEELLKMLGAL